MKTTGPGGQPIRYVPRKDVPPPLPGTSGALGQTPNLGFAPERPSLPPEATDAASTRRLVNALRAALLQHQLAKEE